MADSQLIGTLHWTAATRGQSGSYKCYEQEPHYQVVYYGTAHTEEYQECVLWLPWTYFVIDYSEVNSKYNKLMMVLCASAPVKTE